MHNWTRHNWTSQNWTRHKWTHHNWTFDNWIFDNWTCEVKTLLIFIPEFVLGLAQFSKSESDDLRLQFIFRIYDMDRDGYISNGELFQVL